MVEVQKVAEAQVEKTEVMTMHRYNILYNIGAPSALQRRHSLLELFPSRRC